MAGPFPNTISVTIGRLTSFIGQPWATNADAIDNLITTDRYCYRWLTPTDDIGDEYRFDRVNIHVDASQNILNYTVG